MLIGKSSKRPNLEIVRRLKRALLTVLELPDDATITVSQLACLEQGCAPLETVIGLLRPNVPQLQYKIHKATADVTAADLSLIAASWGFDAKNTAFESFFKVNHIARR